MGLCDSADDGNHPKPRQNGDYSLICLAVQVHHHPDATGVTVISRTGSGCGGAQQLLPLPSPPSGSIWRKSTLWLKCVIQLVSFDGPEGLLFPAVSPITIKGNHFKRRLVRVILALLCLNIYLHGRRVAVSWRIIFLSRVDSQRLLGGPLLFCCLLLFDFSF